jgi:hypothetical protein
MAIKHSKLQQRRLRVRFLLRGAHPDVIITLAARFRVLAIYAFRVYVANGGLMAYGPNNTTPYRRAANYVDCQERAYCAAVLLDHLVGASDQ